MKIKEKNILEDSIYLLTKTGPCPYISGFFEKRIVTDISYNHIIHEELAINGFRRVENWMYRPACDNCSACQSYRVIIKKFELTKSLKRVVKKLNYVDMKIVKNVSTDEHYKLFKKYQVGRHDGGSMSKMTEEDFISMIEISSIDTYLMEFRDSFKKLLGVILIDINKNTLSAVYSFYDTDYGKYGLGNFMITKCLLYGKDNDYKYLYLGYYIQKVSSMAYKIRFKPGQILKGNSWINL